MDSTKTYDPLARVQAYQLAVSAIREGREDARAVAADAMLRDFASQLMRAVASIAANIAEGYSRAAVADRRRFLEYALGSTREAIVWYEASGLRSAPERAERLVTIRRLLLTMIRNSRTDTREDRTKLR